MSLLEELNDKRQRVLDDIAIVDQDVETARQTLASAVADRASLDEKLADLDLAISALTPPLQHKGGETEAGDSADPWTEGHRAGFSAHDRDLNRSDIWQVGYSVGEIDRQRNIALGEPVPNYDGTKPEPPEPISTLQASSGEGEIIVGEPWPGPCGEIAPRAARAEANTEAALAEFMQREGAVRHNGGPRPIPVGWHFEALTRGCGVWPMRNIDVLGSHW
ncbi:MAG TPA: hypothetical protein PK050_17620, partial [Hyphomonadaceae bacterium]|nr:hypothetical protein [Hyphomonadaceae bacterium]